MVGVLDWCQSSANSLVGSTDGDTVGMLDHTNLVVALKNGNYIVASPHWSSGAVAFAGAVTFGNGSIGTVGGVTSTNSLIGAHQYDEIGVGGIAALDDGNYVVGSPFWNNEAISTAGALTWASGTQGISGFISPENSLVGSSIDDRVGGQPKGFAGAYFGSFSQSWDDNGTTNAGAVTFMKGDRPIVEVINNQNSILGHPKSFDFDAFREQVVVGRPDENIVSIRQYSLFADGFE